MFQTLMGANWTSGSLERLGFNILNVLNAKNIMIFALLTDKKVAANCWINSKHKKCETDVR